VRQRGTGHAGHQKRKAIYGEMGIIEERKRTKNEQSVNKKPKIV
jgi:hypothetical protein